MHRRLQPLEETISQETFERANRKFNDTLKEVTERVNGAETDFARVIKEQSGEIHALAKLVKHLTQELVSLKSGKTFQEQIAKEQVTTASKQEVEAAFKKAAEASREAWTNRIKVGLWMTCTKAAIACGCTPNAIRKWSIRHAMSRRRVTGHRGKGVQYEYWIPNTKLKTAPKLKGPSLAGSQAQQARRERERLERLAQRREEPAAQTDLGNQHAAD